MFRRLLRLANELDLPVIVHDRDAHQQVLNCLRQEGASSRSSAPRFSGDAAMAAEATGMGFYISIPGTITYPGNQALRDVVRLTSIDRMLVETDCPYLTSVPHRGKRNEPAHVRLAAERMAEVKGLSLSDVARITTKNMRDLFGIRLWDQSAKIGLPDQEFALSQYHQPLPQPLLVLRQV